MHNLSVSSLRLILRSVESPCCNWLVFFFAFGRMPKRVREEPAKGVNGWAEADDLAKVCHVAKALGSNAAQFEHQAQYDLVEVSFPSPMCAACRDSLFGMLGPSLFGVETGGRSTQAAPCQDT